MTLIQTLIKSFFGIIIILFILWLRFLRQVNGYTFILIDKSYYPFLFISSFFMSIFFLLLYLINVKKISTNSSFKNKFTENFYIKSLINFCIEYIIKSPEYVYLYVSSKFNLKKLIETPASYIAYYFNYPKVIVWIFYLLPQILVATVFVIEICFFNQIIFFYKSLILFIVLLIFRVLRFIVNSYSERMIHHLEKFIDVKFNNKDDIEHSLKPPELLPESWSMSAVIQRYGIISNLWLIYHGIHEYTQKIYEIYLYYIPYVLIYISLCYFLGWSYFFIYLIIHF